MKTKVSEAEGAVLDWLTCEAAGLFKEHPHTAKSFAHIWNTHKETDRYAHPSTDWAQGGPIIQGNLLIISPDPQHNWVARGYMDAIEYPGLTPLIAAMRCYVASRLGDEVEVPEELL